MIKMIVRCAGIVLNKNNEFLAVRSTYDGKEYWILPGGGLELGESLSNCVEREILEETGVKVSAGRLVYMDENLKPNSHMIHFTYLCDPLSEEVTTGSDPDQEEKVIQEAKYISLEELKNMNNFIPPIMKTMLIDNLTNGFSEKVINFNDKK